MVSETGGWKRGVDESENAVGEGVGSPVPAGSVIFEAAVGKTGIPAEQKAGGSGAGKSSGETGPGVWEGIPAGV